MRSYKTATSMSGLKLQKLLTKGKNTKISQNINFRSLAQLQGPAKGIPARPVDQERDIFLQRHALLQHVPPYASNHVASIRRIHSREKCLRDSQEIGRQKMTAGTTSPHQNHNRSEFPDCARRHKYCTTSTNINKKYICFIMFYLGNIWMVCFKVKAMRHPHQCRRGSTKLLYPCSSAQCSSSQQPRAFVVRGVRRDISTTKQRKRRLTKSASLTPSCKGSFFSWWMGMLLS